MNDVIHLTATFRRSPGRPRDLHGEAAAETLAQLVALGGGLTVEISGSPSAAVLAAMAEVQLTIYPFIDGK